MDKIQAVFESERNISHDGNSSHIIVFESGFHSGCKSRDEEIKKLRETLTLIRHICFTSRSGHYTRPETEREDILLLAEETLKEIT